LNGCTSTVGYSTTIGYACNITTVQTTPGTGTTVMLPITGKGTTAPLTIALLLASALVAVGGIYSLRRATR
jgi:hypothetical protein